MGSADVKVDAPRMSVYVHVCVFYSGKNESVM